MSGKPSVCIQICAWNAAPYLRATLASAFHAAAEIPDAEILYYDDASTDESFEIASEIALSNPSLRTVRAQSNQGIAGSNAKAVLETDAEFILKLDGDDILLPGNLASQLSLMKANPSLGAVYGKMLVADESLRPLNRTMGMPFSRFNMSLFNMAGHCGTLLRRSAVLDAGSYRVPAMGARSTGEDFDLFWRMAAISDFHYIDKFTCVYRQHAGQMTRDKSSSFKENLEWMKDSCLESDPALSASLRGNPEAKVDAGSARRASLMLGVLASRAASGDELYGRYAKAACALDPSDYGAKLALFAWHANAKRFDEALDVCRPLAVDDAVDPFIRMKASEVASQLLLSLNRKEEAGQWAVIANHFKKQYMQFDFKSLADFLSECAAQS